jgi:hypothetical protein
VAAEESFDLIAAGLRWDGADLATSLEILAAKLEQALPGRATVRRRGAGLLGRGPKRVADVRVELGDCSYRLELADGRVAGSRERQSGGIAIKRESLEPGAWVSALTKDLREEAQRSDEARAALERLLG